MTFTEWSHDYEWSPEKEAWGQCIWDAATRTERQRLQPVIDALQSCSDAMDYMSEYDIPVNLPLRVSEALRKARGEA